MAALPLGSRSRICSAMVDLPAPGGPAMATMKRFDFPACLKIVAATEATPDMACVPVSVEPALHRPSHCSISRSCPQPPPALTALSACQAVALLFTDTVMPGMNG